MQVPKIFVRSTKFLGKAIVGLLLILLMVLAILHLPPVQKQITLKLSGYLSSKTEARVDIQRIKFSLLGNATIDDLSVWDPDDTKIFSAHKIEVASSIYNLIKGDFIFDQVHIEGADVNLIQHQEGLNIQFILDAFKPKEKQTTTPSNPITLQFKKVRLENVRFEFTSTVSGTTVAVNLGTFTGQEAEFSTSPLKIKADQIILERSAVNTLSVQRPDTLITLTKSTALLPPDFGIGIVFEIRDLQLKDDEFSFNRNQVATTQKFDPSHITLKNIQLSVSDVLMRADTLTTNLQSLSAQLPGFTLTDARAGIHLNRNQLVLSGLHLASGVNELQADLTAPNDLSEKDGEYARAEIAVQGRIDPNDLSYFFSDSLIDPFSRWGPTQLTVEGNYTLHKGELKILNLKTGNSQLHANGMVSDVMDYEKISWKELEVDASIGADFKRILTPFLRNINLPPRITLQLKSSGNPTKISADAKIFSNWGDAKALGTVTRQANTMDLDINLTGEKVDLGQWMNLAWLGPMNLTAGAKGSVGDNQNIEIQGLISDIALLNQSIHHIAFQSTARKDSATVAVSIKDTNYRSEINSEISFTGPLTFTNVIQLDSFKLGRLLHQDSTLFISGDTKSNIMIDTASLEGFMTGKHMLFHKQSIAYSLDTMAIHATLSPAKSDFTYYTDYAKMNLAANFDIREISEVIDTWSGNILNDRDYTNQPTGTRAAHFTMDLENASILKLLGIDVDDFSALHVMGEFDEQKQTSVAHATTGKFKGYGVSLDTLNTDLMVLRDSIRVSIKVKDLLYNKIRLGNLDFDVVTQGDTALSNLRLFNDSTTLLGLGVRMVPSDSGVFVFPDQLEAFDHNFIMDAKNPVYVNKNNLVFTDFQISRDSMQINLDGDFNYFDVSLKQVDLTPLNFLLSPDTTILNKGHLTGKVSYSRDQQINLNAHIDSLILYQSSPLSIRATAVSEGNQVPFQFLLTNTSNKIDLKGSLTSGKEVDASLLLDVNNLEMFDFLVSGFIDEMKGAIQGEALISGPLQKPNVKGHVRFLDVGLTTLNPKLTFNIPDDRITLNNESLVFDHFTLFDKDQHPLIINGNLTSKDYESIEYDLQINSDEYTLINNPDSTSGKIRGLLVIDSDIKLKGNAKDRNVEANLTIKDATDLTFVNSKGDVELLNADGIIDFIDPALLLDSTALKTSANFYDSLLASLPAFTMNSSVTIEDNAALRLIIDEQSGDYIEASGGANLDLSYDRTGNLQLIGGYTIKKGVYRLSFYDLVKKNFTLVQGSSVNWHGSAKNGDLNIKASHIVESNSLGLIGHEIGENEKSIYKRSLDYEVGININGTIEKPIISFSLDLPQNEKVSYPVLANKLDRLRQPEYASELNKQVFGLLVLGGFLPESSADVNSNVIATTALANSVNSLLASQLNRFASQYVKGVNIDVGIQSYSDYSAPGGKTQTAMDFRVSKSILNDRLSFEIGGDFDISQDQSGANTGTKNYRGDIAIIYDLTGNGDKQLKLFNNETYDIIYQEIRNTGISLIFIREFENKEKNKNK
jgi:TamB, inner membrane protein subunit of TAM complex